MLLIAGYLSLLTVVGAQLQCHPETLTYSYVNDIKVWGAVGQSFRVSLLVDIDCQGESDLSDENQHAFDYAAHFYNVTISDTKIKPENAAKLCGKQLDAGITCTVGDGSGVDDTEDVISDMSEMFLLPVRFTQSETGSILRVLFMEKDFEHQDVMNMKKGVISSLQTKITGPGEIRDTETDSTGSHTAIYRSRQLGEGLLVEKEYKVDADGSSRSKILKTAEVRVKSQAVVEQGEIVDSKGEITTEMEEDDEELAIDDIPSENIASEIKIEEVVHSNSKFDMKLTIKKTRSPSRQRRLVEYHRLTFLPTSLKMDALNDNTEDKYDQLSSLYEQLRVTTIEYIVKEFAESGDETKLSTIRDTILLETELGFQHVQGKLGGRDGPLVDKVVLISYGVLSQCQERWGICRDILELCALGGRRSTEEVFEFLLSKESTMDSENQVDVLNLAAYMANPSDRFVLFLVHQINELPEDSDFFGALVLTLGSLAGHTSVSENTKQVVRAIILKELETINTDDCSDDVRYADALEAIGNMGDIHFLDRLLEVNMACRDSTIMRVALLHAMRNFLSDSRVQSLMIHTLSAFECEVSEDMINLLSEEMQEQQLDESLVENWPSTGFNQFDHVLANFLLYTPYKLPCLRSEAIRYFGLKLSPMAREITESLSNTHHEEQGTEPLSSTLYEEQGNHTISKRGVKKHSSCTSWNSNKGRYKVINNAKTFKKDLQRFNKRKHCLVHLGLGPSKANVEILAGFFAGFKKPVKSGQVKLFAKAVARGKIFKKKFTIATVYLYFERSSKKTLAGRVYAKVGKKVLISKKLKKPNYKSTNKLYSSPTITIPVGKIPLYVTTINLSVKLQGKIILTTQLRVCKKPNICLSFKPKAVVTITGSATINLAAVRGGAEVKVSLNYYVKGEGQARIPKSPCVSTKHGHDKASVSLSFYYETRSKVKIGWPPKISFKWSDRKTYGPSSLKWTIAKAKESKIYSNC